MTGATVRLPADMAGAAAPRGAGLAAIAGLGWGGLLLPPVLLMLVTLLASQSVFIASSLHRDLGMGRTAAAWTLQNYDALLSDGLFLRCLWITVRVSALATIFTLIPAFAVGYAIARMRSAWSGFLLAAIIATNFITIVVKAFGLMIIFAADGVLNRLLTALHLVDQPVALLGSESGVVVGLMQFTLGFAVLLLTSVIRTVPRGLEEAALAHGASRARVLRRVLLPLCLPGLCVAALMIFNMCMGAFTSAALLGSGRILTLPVLIQQTVMMQVNYAMAATLSVVLLVAVLAINVLTLVLVRRSRVGRMAVI